MWSTKRKNNKEENNGIQKTRDPTQEENDGNPQDGNSESVTDTRKTQQTQLLNTGKTNVKKARITIYRLQHYCDISNICRQNYVNSKKIYELLN